MATDDTITRYGSTGAGQGFAIVVRPDGPWVRYEDHQRAIERLQEELAHARGLVDSWCDEYNRVKRERDEARAKIARLRS